MTGCLRIAKESIFTGTNNFITDTISDNRLDEFFGFTQEEVDRILADTQNTSHSQEIKNWYDGYRFGNVDVYCPWDVINYCSDHIEDPYLPPQNYWLNTSGNEMIYHFIDGLEDQTGVTKEELELLEEYILEGKDIASNEKIEKHAAWAAEFLPKYKDINKENVHEILQKEVGIVFTHVLEDAGVYKCTPEGREAFMRFINKL